MNSIRQVQALNKRELDNVVYATSLHDKPPEASWHSDYRDTAYIYVGGLPYELSEGDIITIFSQFGEPVHVNLVRDKGTGKSRGFAFLKYEDQRSTDLAVDNLGGATVLGRTLRVDHMRYKRREGEGDLDNIAARIGDDVDTHGRGKARGDRSDESDAEAEESRRPMLKEEMELAKLIQDHDDEDPMKEYLIREKKEEVSRALEKWESSNKKASRREDSDERSRRSRHNHHHHHRRHDEHRSGARERSHQDAPTERRSYRDRSPRERRKAESLSRERGSFRNKSHSRDRWDEGDLVFHETKTS
ncbi:hypothetical protein V8E54_010273 [Elaphomyces granulatus]